MQKIAGNQNLSYTQNREFSWLKFNERVLEEATDINVPIMERFHYISIFLSNLDEFFMVRVGRLYDLTRISPKRKENKQALTSQEQLKRIYSIMPALLAKKDSTYFKVMSLLSCHHIRDKKACELTQKQAAVADSFYNEKVAPLLKLNIIGSSEPLPAIKSSAIYVVAELYDGEEKLLGFVEISNEIPRIKLLTDCYVRTEELVMEHLSTIFASYKLGPFSMVRIIRNADTSFDDEKFEDDEDFIERTKKMLKKRSISQPLRIDFCGDIHVADGIRKRLGLSKYQMFSSQSPLDLSYVSKLKNAFPSLCFAPFRASQFSGFSVIKAVLKHDIMLFYPYDSMDTFIRLLHEAAFHKNVVSIRMTSYRLAKNSKIARNLMVAAKRGKSVTVIMELRARFDELNNIEWSKKLTRAGCKVFYGFEGYKCHAKLCEITMLIDNKIRSISVIGTGNFNEDTAKIYTDISFMTSNGKVAADALSLFIDLKNANFSKHKSLLCSPIELKSELINLIEREAKKGNRGRIILKANAITDRDIIDKLSYASNSGVKIDLIIRGICCILPGIPQRTENIKVTSVVGRFLEHSRIYVFGDDVYISSADLMTRNLNRRIEAAYPIRDLKSKQKLLAYLSLILHDDEKARNLNAKGRYVKPVKKNEINSQAEMMNGYLRNPDRY